MTAHASPPDIREDEYPTCPKCGADTEWVDCYELDCEHGQWLDDDGVNAAEWVACQTCGGHGGWDICSASCEAKS